MTCAQWHLFLYQPVSLPCLCANLQSAAQWRRPFYMVHIKWFAFFVCCLFFKFISENFLLCLINISRHPLQWDVYFTIYCIYCSCSRSPVGGAVMQQPTRPCSRGFPWSDSLNNNNNLSGFIGTHDTLEHTREYMDATQDTHTHTHTRRPEVAVNLSFAFSHPGLSFLQDPPGAVGSL